MEAGGIDRLLLLTAVSTQNDRTVCLTAKVCLYFPFSQDEFEI